MLTLALWLIAIGMIVCAGFLFAIMMRGERLARVLAVQLNSMSDTHMQGFEALTIQLKRLEERIDLCERQIATATWAQFVDHPDHGPP
jgi:hypothetical protein